MDDYFAQPPQQNFGSPAPGSPAQPRPFGGQYPAPRNVESTDDKHIDYLADAYSAKKRPGNAMPAKQSPLKGTPAKSSRSTLTSRSRRSAKNGEACLRKCCLSTFLVTIMVALFTFITMLHVFGFARFIPVLAPESCQDFY
ncbi:hypothetical protein Aduo_013733 [Ancylostoma duodenale]